MISGGRGVVSPVKPGFILKRPIIGVAIEIGHHLLALLGQLFQDPEGTGFSWMIEWSSGVSGVGGVSHLREWTLGCTFVRDGRVFPTKHGVFFVKKK